MTLNVISDNGTHKVESAGVLYVPPAVDIYLTANEVVTINGNAPEPLSPVYFASKGDALSIVVDIVDADNVVQTQIDQTALGYPPVLGLPLQKTKGVNGDIESELYLTTTIINGHMTALLSTGELTIGNWELTEERVNGSLAEIGADWKVSMNTISIRVL